MLRTIILTAMLFALHLNILNAQDPYAHKIDSLEKVIRSLEKVDQLEKKIQSLQNVDKTEKKISISNHPKVKELTIQNLNSEIKRAKGGLTAGILMTAVGGFMLLGGVSETEDGILSVFLKFNGGLMAIPGAILTLANGTKLSNLKKVQLSEMGELEVNAGNSGIGLKLSF